MPSVIHILQRAQKGDREAEDELFRHLLVRFLAIAAHRLGDKYAAEEVAQQACVTVFEKYRTETFTTGFDAWAYGVLRMKILSYYHARSNERIVPQIDSSTVLDNQTDDDLPGSEIERRVVACLGKILRVNQRYARILNLIYLGYRAPEISERLGVQCSHLYVMLNRARAMMKKCLSEGEL